MKITPLAEDCTLLHFDDLNILINCPDLSKVFDNHQVPSWGTIDLLLISNFISGNGIPTLLETTNFTGQIVMTNATKSFLELFWQNEFNVEKHVLPCTEIILQETKEIFWTREKMQNTLASIRIIPIHMNFPISNKTHMVALHSGYCIGSCNWIFHDFGETIAFIGKSGVSTIRHPYMISFDDFTVTFKKTTWDQYSYIIRISIR